MYLGIILVLIAILAVIVGGVIFCRRRNNRRMIEFVIETASVPVEELPKIAAGFAAFLQETHGIDLRNMSFAEQVRYILENLHRFWRPEMKSHIPVSLKLKAESEKLPVIAAGAYLGELTRMIHHAEWRKDPGMVLKAPYLEIGWSGEDRIPCHPFDIVLLAFMTGDTRKALADSLGFESPEVLNEHVRNRRRGNLYADDERANVESFIRRMGPVEKIFNIVNSSEMQVDMYIIEPTREYAARRLVTCGMGGRTMTVPDEYGSSPNRVELIVDLPPDWKVDEESWEDKCFCWPVSLLKSLAGFPWSEGVWFRLGYAVPWPEPFADNTRLSGVLIASPAIDFESGEVKISPDKKVQFYQAVPLYPEELAYRIEHGTRKLYEMLGEQFSYIIDPQRKNAVTGQ